MKIYVIVTESKVHAYTSWGRATQVAERFEAFFGEHAFVVETVPSKRKATKTDAEIIADSKARYARAATCRYGMECSP